jgi:hypothetical protein
MTPITDNLQNHAGAAAATAMVLEYLKQSNLPLFRWITPTSTKVLVALSAFVAYLTTMGWQFQWDGTPSVLGVIFDGGNFTAHVPPLVSLVPSLDNLMTMIGQMGWTQLFYHGAVKPAVK